MGKKAKLSLGFLPPPKALGRFSSVPMTVKVRPSKSVISLPMGSVVAEEVFGGVVAKDGDAGGAVHGRSACRSGRRVRFQSLTSRMLKACRRRERDVFNLVRSPLGDRRSRRRTGSSGIAQRGGGGDDVRELADGHGVVVGELLAGEHLGGGTHADDGETEDPRARWCRTAAPCSTRWS